MYEPDIPDEDKDPEPETPEEREREDRRADRPDPKRGD